MKNKALIYFITTIFFIGQLHVDAQDNSVAIRLDSMTLENAIEYVMKNSTELSLQNLKRKQDEIELSRLKSNKLPDVYLSGDIRRNIIIPSTPIPATMMNSGADPGQMLYMKFNTDWNSGAGINLSYDIFNPLTFRQVAEQRQLNKINSYDSRLSEKDLILNISQAYAGCVISQAQMESFITDTAFYFRSMVEASYLYKKEKISLSEKNNSVIAYNNSLMQYLQAGRVLDEAKTNLLNVMGVEVSEKNIKILHLTEDIQALYSKIMDSGSDIDAGDHVSGQLDKSLSLSRQSEMVLLAENRTKSAKLKYLPSVSVSGFYGANYYDNSLNLNDGSLWHGNSFMGLSLKIPLTRVFTTSKEVTHFKLQEQIEKANLQKMQNQKEKEFADSKGRLEVYKREYEMNKENYDLTVQNLKASQESFDKGYILEKDLLSGKLQCRNALQSLLQAAYNVFISTTDLKKAQEE
ncbi:MAG TPA: TolC family protein [Bacteroidales bacterium]|nr:TolC family protein [Bacteroidales bacterium]HPT10997.1 TolC family protein [Bacteroidales bacterium]